MGKMVIVMIMLRSVTHIALGWTLMRMSVVRFLVIIAIIRATIIVWSVAVIMIVVVWP